MQTIRIPYTVAPEHHHRLMLLRREQSAAIRTAYANAADIGDDGEAAFASEKDLRNLVKDRFGTKVLDSWALHCATRIGLAKRRLVPDGAMVFGGAKHLLRRNDGLIDNSEWRIKRLLPFTSYGDAQKRYGNQNVHLLSEDHLQIHVGRMLNGRKSPHVLTTVDLHLKRMSGNAGKIVQQLVEICGKPKQGERINVTYSIDEHGVSVTFDPMDLPDHPERRRPVSALPDRAIGIDLNPGSIGVAAVHSLNPQDLEETRLLETFLAEIDLPAGASDEQMRELLARVCDRTIGLARKHRAGVIVVEKGLGKLRSGGRGRANNRRMNHWCRTVLIHMLTRQARLAGIKVVEVWSAYSTTIGNLAFEAPDACASAAEIGRRGLARAAGQKELLPAMVDEVVLRRWKDEDLPMEHREMLRRSSTWGQLHRGLKTAKLGVRRPHPTLSGLDAHGTCHGHAVRRLGLKHRHGLLWQPAHAPNRGDRVGGLSTRKSE